MSNATRNFKSVQMKHACVVLASYNVSTSSEKFKVAASSLYMYSEGKLSFEYIREFSELVPTLYEANTTQACYICMLIGRNIRASLLKEIVFRLQKVKLKVYVKSWLLHQPKTPGFRPQGCPSYSALSRTAFSVTQRCPGQLSA